MRGLLVITLIGLLLVVAIASGLCPCSLDPKGSESISVNASLHAEPLKTTTSTTTTTIPKPNLGPGHKSKTKLELVRNEVSLTHACSYYEISYPAGALGKFALIRDLATLKISKAKEVHGKLKDVTVEIKVREPYQVEVPIYGNCTGYVSLANLTNSTVKRCEDLNLTTYNETHCVYNYTCVVDYRKETRYRWVWKPLRWHDFRGMAKRAYRAPRKVKDLLDFDRVRDLLWDSFERERKVEIRVCGNYQPEFTDGAWRVAIDHVPFFKDREFWKFTWWNASWQYRKPITITEQSGNTLTDYQVAINITYDSEMQSDFDDLRFTWLNETSGDEQEIPYWIESKVDSDWAYVWIKVPEIPANGEATVYMYYGNSDATSESNGDNVFEFFDDFEGTSLDTSKWEVTSSSAGSYSVSNSKLYINLKTNTGSSKALTIRNKNAYPYSQIGSYIFEGYIKASGETYAETGWILSGFAVGKENSGGGGWDNKYCVGWEGYNDRYALHSWIGSMKSIELTASNDVWYIYYLHITSSSNAKGCIGDSCANSNWDIGSTTNYRWVLGGQGNAYVEYWIDWVRVRKFADPEPTYSIGSEEQQTYTFNYRIPITINNTANSNTLTDYQILITIDTQTPISEGKMRSDCGDIRFTNSTSYDSADWAVRYPYWIESGCGTTSTKIWVKVDTIPAGANKTIYMYYGNSDATSESNGDNVFEFFDDFEVDLSKWKQTKTSSTSVIQRTTEQAYSGSYSVEVYQTVDDGDTELYNDSLNYNTAVVVWHFYDDGGESRNHYLGADDSATIVYIGVQRYANNYHYRIGDTNYESSIARSTGWHEFKWIFYGSGVKGYIDGTEIFDTNSVTTLTRIGAFDVWAGREGWYQDTVYVRKFADPEPTITLGTEEFVSPVVESVVTYNETYGNQTTFSPGDKVIIRANVTHPLGNQYVDSAVITIIDNSSTVQVNNESMTLVTPFSGVYADWSYRRVITIAEQSGSTLTDYQVLLTLDTETLISENKLRSDCGDLRFTYYNETSGEEVSIPYWVESGCGTTDTKVWIKVPEIPANDNATVYMYYGNPDATSESNADEVFDLFDDFEGTSLDTSKWSEVLTPSYSLSNSLLHITTNERGEGLKSILDHGEYIITMKLMWTAGTYFEMGILTCYQNEDNFYSTHTSTYNDRFRILKRVSGADSYLAYTSHTPEKNIWTTLTLIIKDTSTGNFKAILDDENGNHLELEATDTELTTGKIGMGTMSNSEESVDVDYFLVRKFADPEPSYEIGEEETLAEKLTFEYNYTIPSDAVGGTWRAIVYANDTNGNWGSNETTFEVVVDFEPPTITFVSQTPANLNESSTEPVTIIINITDPSGVNESRIAFFHGVNHTLGIAGTGFYHYNWSWRYPANDLQPDMRRADFRNMSYWFEDVVFKESPDDIWTFAGYDKTISEVFKIVDSGTNYTTVNITFFSAQMLFPQIFPFDKYYLTKENKTNQYVELYNNQWMKLKFYPKMFYNYTQENYTIYLDLNVDPSFTPNTRPLEIYFCNSSYTTGDPSKTSNCAYVEEIDSTDTRTIVIANSSYIQNVFYIADGYIDGVKVTDEAYLVLRTTAPPTQAFRLHYADDVINEYINFTNFGHAWVSSDNGNTWNPVSYTPDFYLIATQAERDKVMYYVYACDNYGNCANSTIQYDSLDPVNHPPGEPLIIEPAENATLTGLVNASWLTIGDPDFDPFNASIHLFYPDGTYFTTIAENIPGSNQQYNYTYEFNTSLYPTGTYRLNVTLCDSHGLCSSSITPYNFTIYHVYEQPLEQGMTTSAYLRRILGKGQIVAVIVYDYLARTFMGYREILTVTSVTEALRIVLVRELEELFTINIGFVEIPIKNLPVALTTTTELSTWFKQLRYLSDQLATSLTLAMEVVTLRVGEVSFSVSEAVARAVNMVRVSDLPVLISESLVKTIEVVREAEIAVTLAESLGKWIGVARIGEVAILVTDVMIRSINVAREMVAYLTSTVLLTVTRMETFLAQITVSDAVARVVIAVRPVVETISLILRFTLEYPAIPTFLLPAPPYALFAWATNIETLFVLLVAISVAIIVSTVYVFNKRHELFEHPTERFFGKKKKKR